MIREIVNGHRAIWRSVTMIAAADRGPAEIRIDGLKEAAADCGIDLTPASDTNSPPQPANFVPYSSKH
ncbi:MAG TPA: hypothetical protein VLC74_05455 [Rhizomicrobium sp.]|nr:hypothetical protein [Rhizomicrobium sp.]